MQPNIYLWANYTTISTDMSFYGEKNRSPAGLNVIYNDRLWAVVGALVENFLSFPIYQEKCIEPIVLVCVNGLYQSDVI